MNTHFLVEHFQEILYCEKVTNKQLDKWRYVWMGGNKTQYFRSIYLNHREKMSYK